MSLDDFRSKIRQQGDTDTPAPDAPPADETPAGLSHFRSLVGRQEPTPGPAQSTMIPGLPESRRYMSTSRVKEQAMAEPYKRPGWYATQQVTREALARNIEDVPGMGKMGQRIMPSSERSSVAPPMYHMEEQHGEPSPLKDALKETAQEAPARLREFVWTYPSQMLQFMAAEGASKLLGLADRSAKLAGPLGWIGSKGAKILPKAIEESKIVQGAGKAVLEGTKDIPAFGMVGGAQSYAQARAEGKTVPEALKAAAKGAAVMGATAPLFAGAGGALEGRAASRAVSGAESALAAGERFSTSTEMYGELIKRGVPEADAMRLSNVDPSKGPTPGRANINYPVLAKAPETVPEPKTLPALSTIPKRIQKQYPTLGRGVMFPDVPKPVGLTEAVQAAGGLHPTRGLPKGLGKNVSTAIMGDVVSTKGLALPAMQSRMARLGYEVGKTPEDFLRILTQDQAAKDAGFRTEHRVLPQARPSPEIQSSAERPFRMTGTSLPGEVEPSQAPPQVKASASAAEKQTIQTLGRIGWGAQERAEVASEQAMGEWVRQLQSDPDNAAVRLVDELTKGGLKPADATRIAERLRGVAHKSPAHIADELVQIAQDEAETIKQIPLQKGDSEFFVDGNGDLQVRENKRRIFNWESKHLDMSLLSKLSPEASQVYRIMEAARGRVRSGMSRLDQELTISHGSVGKGADGKRLDSAILADETLGRRLTEDELKRAGITGKLRAAYDRLRSGTETIGEDMRKSGMAIRDPRTHHPDVYKGAWRVFNEGENSMYGRFLTEKEARDAAAQLSTQDPKGKYLVTRSWQLPGNMDTKALMKGVRGRKFQANETYFANALARRGGFRNYLPDPVEAQYAYETTYWRKKWMDQALGEVLPVLEKVRASGDRVLADRLEGYVKRVAFGEDRVGSDFDSFMDRQIGVKGVAKMEDLAAQMFVQNSIGGNIHVPLIVAIESPITSIMNPKIGLTYTARGIAEYEGTIAGLSPNKAVNAQVLELAGEHNPLRYGSAGATLKRQLRPTQILTAEFNRAKDFATGFPMLGRYWRVVEEQKLDPKVFHEGAARDALEEAHWVSGNFSGTNMPEYQAHRAMRLLFLFKHYPKMVAERLYTAMRTDPKLAAALLTVPPILFGVSRVPFAEKIPGEAEWEAENPKLAGGVFGAVTGLTIGAGHGLASIWPQRFSDLSPPVRNIIDFAKSSRGAGDVYEQFGPAGKSAGRIGRGVEAMQTGVARTKRGEALTRVTPLEAAGMAVGFTPTKVQREYAIQRADAERNQKIQALRNRVKSLLWANQPIPADLRKELQKYGMAGYPGHAISDIETARNAPRSERGPRKGQALRDFIYQQELRRAAE